MDHSQVPELLERPQLHRMCSRYFEGAKMKIELDLNDNELSILKGSISRAIDSNLKFLCDEFVHEQKKDEVKRENSILCGILTKVNKQTQRRISL